MLWSLFGLTCLILFSFHDLVLTVVLGDENNKSNEDEDEGKVKDCSKRLETLVDRYMEPHLKDGITRQMIDDAFFEELAVQGTVKLTETVLIQVLENKIYIDDRFLKDAPISANCRLSVILNHLDSFLAERIGNSTDGKNTTDFEFVLDLKECQSAWRKWEYEGVQIYYPDLSSDQAVVKYSKLPIFTLTKCDGRATIPLPQWSFSRDWNFREWDEMIEQETSHALHAPHMKRENKATFRGCLATFSSYDPDGHQAPIHVNETNWHLVSRGKMQFLSFVYPKMFDVSVQEIDTFMFGQEYSDMVINKEYITMPDQLSRFRHVIYAEGWCGWADRLKHLLYYESTILMQQTPCSEYYAGLLVPGEHYIPIDGTFDNLVDQTTWAINNPAETALMVKRTAKLAKECFSQASVLEYSSLIFKKYASLMRYKPSKRTHAKEFPFKGAGIPDEYPQVK